MISPRHRRRLNAAMHELRRPLQALVLLGDGIPASSPPVAARRGLLELASAALADLDGAVNGGAAARPVREVSCRELVLASLERWRPVAGGDGIRVYWDAGQALVEGDPIEMAQAFDNLIANALEHGGPPLIVTGATVAGRLRVTVANGARDDDRKSARFEPEGSSRGHGVATVSRIASEHRGRFALCRTGSGCVAALELPLAGDGLARAA